MKKKKCYENQNKIKQKDLEKTMLLNKKKQKKRQKLNNLQIYMIKCIKYIEWVKSKNY